MTTAAAATGHRADIHIAASSPPDAVRVPADYLGLSIEWSMVQHWFGTSRAMASPVMIAVLQSLQRDRSLAGVLRIGGNSQDGYVYDPAGSLDANTLFTGTITNGLIDALFEVAARSGWRVILGLNLRGNDPARAAALAGHVAAADTGQNLLAFEVGNEPNAYFGTDVPGYLERFTSYAQALGAAAPPAPVAGPAVSNGGDLSYVRELTSAPPDQLEAVTWHHYANRPSRGALLGDETRTAWLDRITAVRQAAAGAGRPARLGEGNSVGNGGLDGVSNVLASATWLVETLLSGAAAGLPGYQLHSWDGQPYPSDGRTCWYTPFVLRQGLASGRPPFYGLALCRHAAGRTVRPLTLAAGATEVLSSYAFVDEQTRRIYVYILERSGRGGYGTVSVTAPVGYGGAGFLSRLGDAGGCGGKTPGINGFKLPANGAFAWDGHAVRPVPGTNRYDVLLGPCEVLLLSLGPIR